MVDADDVNNKYIVSLVSKIVDLGVLIGKNIVLWPFLGTAPELIKVLESCGANVILIDNNLDPPDPTRGFEEESIKLKMEENDAKIAIMLDADRDRVVFIIRIAGKFYNLEPNQLYTAMHNILSREMKKNIVNVKTIPSDPGCDETSKINFICGVGYKHLGILQYLAADAEVPQSQVDLSVIYHFIENKYVKLHSQEEIKKIIKKTFPGGSEVIFAIW